MLTSVTKNRINACRDILVGKIPDPKWQIDQITNALVYKFMDDQDRSSRELWGVASFFVDDYERYAWTRLFDTKLTNQDRANLYIEWLDKLSKADHLPDLFKQIFKDAYLPFRDANTIVMFLTEINGFDYHHSEELGNAFEYLLSIMGSQGDAGQFRTPRHIIEFLVDVVDPQKHETILDPACWTAGFLVEAFTHIRDKWDLGVQDIAQLSGNITGVDIDPGMAKIARVNLYLHGFKTPKITENDTLTDEKLWGHKYDVILANPPFMTPKGGIQPHDKFAIRANRAEVLFTDYIAEHLRLHGRAGIIVPDWIVTATNAEYYTSLRRNLVNWFLWWVVSLPAWLFEPYSKSKTWILFLDKDLNKSRDSIIFWEVLNDWFELNSTRKPISKNDLPEILEWLLKWKSSSIKPKDSRFSFVEKTDLLKNSKIILSPNSYKTINLKPWFVRIWDLLEKSNSWKVGNQSAVPVMSITMENWLIDQSKKFKKRIANLDTSKYKLVRKNELVVWFPMDEWVLGFQKDYEFAAVSPAYDIWTLKDNNTNIEALELILRSKTARENYAKLTRWTANRRRVVPKDDFLKMEIPDPNNENIMRLVEFIKRKRSLEIEIKSIEWKIDNWLIDLWND